jgi:hypothetical protein
LETPEAVLHVGPYTLGCWLGDGTSADGTITFGDAEIAEGIASEGYRMGELIGVRTMRRTIYGLGPLLRSLNLLRNKHIPVFYQRASTAQRLALLRGLMDTDGHCNTRGTATFVNKNEQLVDNVMELCTGLGLKPSKYRFEAPHGTYWHVAFQAYQDHNPFLITRKASRVKTGARPHPRRYITAIYPIPTEAMRCIQVDRPDGLYLTGRSMVTIHDGTSTTLYR